MVEIQVKDLSPKSQKSRFAPVIFAEANALSKKRPEESLAALEAHARANVAHKEYDNRLRKEMDTDLLTGALSRKAIFRGIRESLAEVDRKGGQIQVLFMDLKGLKQFNDKFGHDAGDVALKFLVRGVMQHIRAYDEIGRYGGDEFIVLRKDGPLSADRLVEDLGDSLRQLKAPYNRVGATVGVVNYSKEMGSISVEQLVHRADQAFYYAKGKNIDTPVTWEPSMGSIVVPK